MSMLSDTPRRWARGSFRQSFHVIKSGRDTLCGTPLGHGMIETVSEEWAHRKCGRCQRRITA